MKILLIIAALSLGQMNTLQSKPVLRLGPNHYLIDSSADGKKVQLINSSPIISLPATPPKPVDREDFWTVDVQNLGPGPVTIVGRPNLSIKLNLNESIRIFSDGATYTQKR